jgi:hypothetical protein
MGYRSKVQVIQRANQNKQYYFICPSPLAQAMEVQKGEEIEWVIEDKNTIIIKRDVLLREATKRGGRRRA